MHTIKTCALLGTVAATLTSGCSTVTGGTKQQVAITTPGVSTASCRVTGGQHLDKVVTTPATLTVHKGHPPITVACNADGQPTVTRVFKPHYSNASKVQMPGGYALDAISGAMWTYPTDFVVPMGTAAAASSSAKDVATP